MKFLLLLVIGLTLLSCSSKKYLLADQNSDNQRLIAFIGEMKKENKIENNPVIVIDEKVIDEKELKNLKIFSDDIADISFVDKGNMEMTQVYGEQSLNGLILIKTKSFKEKAKKSYSDSKILFLVDGQVISQEEIEKVDPNDIETVTVIKNKEDILKYASEHYDGVILIEMKK